MSIYTAIRVSFFATFVLAWTFPCNAQVERYELGKRLRRFEQAWQDASPEIRVKSTPAMQQAVSSFFSLQLKTAAEKLDQAWFALGDKEISDWQKACAACRIELEKTIFRLSDNNNGTTQPDSDNLIKIRLKSFYKVEESTLADETKVLMEFSELESEQIVHQFDTDFVSAQKGVEVVANTFSEGDYLIRCRLKKKDSEFLLLCTSFSVLTDLESKVRNMEQVQRDKSLEINGSVRATLGEYRNLLQQGQEPFSAETDYPFRRILELANTIIHNPQDSSRLISEVARKSDLWMVLAEDRKRVPVRLRLPPNREENTAEKIPVLFLFHGAGGSENMFFETYGAGQAVKQGIDRGWLVVAPRQGLTGLGLNCQEMLNALESFFPIDRTRVFLLGHSMGAAQVIQQVGINPDLPRAAAAIGGGRAVRDAKKIANVPWFVSAGELDFGRSGAKAFHQSLVKAEAVEARYLECPGIEHLVIVQASLPQAFEFFDKADSSR